MYAGKFYVLTWVSRGPPDLGFETDVFCVLLLRGAEAFFQGASRVPEPAANSKKTASPAWLVSVAAEAGSSFQDK
jgi:hypothetical protein